jgi:hypothetical protein
LFLVIALPGCGGEDAAVEEEAPEHEAAVTREADPAAGMPGGEGDAGPAVRRSVEGCEPVEEARQYEGLVGKRALAILRWTGMPERTAKLRIPVYLVSIEGGAISLRFIDFPMREQYINIWLGSGHIAPGTGDAFLLDPCSASIEPWSAMERE